MRSIRVASKGVYTDARAIIQLRSFGKLLPYVGMFTPLTMPANRSDTISM